MSVELAVARSFSISSCLSGQKLSDWHAFTEIELRSTKKREKKRVKRFLLAGILFLSRSNSQSSSEKVV